MRLRIVVALITGLVTLGLAGCSQTSLTMQDAYKIGCPAIDAASATGSVGSKVAVKTLTEIRDHGNPSPEAEQWLDAAIQLLDSDDPSDVSKATKKLIINGCKQHGYELQNFG